MRKPIPPITETVDDLKQRLQHERDARKKPRIQMLYLLASGQAHNRLELAALLAVHRNTIGHWISLYARGGLDSLLDLYVAKGKPLSLAPDILASLEQALQQPSGFASYDALRQWLHQTHQIDIKYKTLYTIVRTRFKTKLKVPRPSHTKKTPKP
jgi:transposase